MLSRSKLGSAVASSAWLTILALASCSSAPDQPSAPSMEPVTTTATADSSSTTQPSAEAVDDPVTREPLVGQLTATVVATHPHDSTAFTQGLEVLGDGSMIESTGLNGESDRRIVVISTGAVVEKVEIDSEYFGEGITVVDDEVIQLTWKAGRYFRADRETLSATGGGSYDGEGWGLCHDGDRLIMSDGTPTLTFRDPESFAPLGTIDVRLNGEPLSNLNELECVRGQVLANVWLTEWIVVIDPTSGEVAATFDASDLRPEGLPADDSNFALNGIAHDPATGHFFLTGKLWPVLYEVELS